MPMINPFNIFSVAEISAAIENLPNMYGRINDLNLMPVKGVVSRDIAIEERNGSLALIPTDRLGGPGTTGASGKRQVRTFRVPSLIQEDFASPQDVLGIRAFGGNEQANLANLLADKLQTCRAKHDITLEHLRMGALKGQILDADGSIIYNLFTEFGVTQKVIDFKLGTAGTDVRAKCLEVKRHIEDHLLGDRMTATRCLVSPEFFDKLTNHAQVKEAFANYQAAQERLGGDMRTGFTYGGLIFEEYRAITTGLNGPMRFIADGEGHAFPEGGLTTFTTHVAPADFNEAVGSLGQLYYAKTQAAKFDRGWDIHTQSNPLPLCHRPAVLVKMHTSN